MKTPKFIIKGLVSGRVKLTPELLEAMKKYSAAKESGAREQASPKNEPRPAESTSQPPAGGTPSCRSERRLVFVSPLPGRWIRCCGLAMACVALWLAPRAHAAAPDSDFNAANRAFAETRLEAAVHGYQGILDRSGYSAPTLFNLANAQLREGKTGPAILNYERARWLAPNDPDIAANLNLARNKAGLPSETVSGLRSALSILNLNAWAAVGLAALLFLAAIPPLKRLRPATRPALNTIAALAALAFVTAILAVGIRWPELDRAIVTASETAVRISPVNGIPPLFMLHSGESVNLKRVHGSFALVTDSHGQEGWVARETITSIVPPVR
jgi:tetratricopeptide (TPR) repeat protein